jgi:hypothetical protein
MNLGSVTAAINWAASGVKQAVADVSNDVLGDPVAKSPRPSPASAPAAAPLPPADAYKSAAAGQNAFSTTPKSSGRSGGLLSGVAKAAAEALAADKAQSEAAAKDVLTGAKDLACNYTSGAISNGEMLDATQKAAEQIKKLGDPELARKSVETYQTEMYSYIKQNPNLLPENKKRAFDNLETVLADVRHTWKAIENQQKWKAQSAGQ